MIHSVMSIWLLFVFVRAMIAQDTSRPSEMSLEQQKTYIRKSFDLHDLNRKSGDHVPSGATRSSNAAAKYLHRLYLKETHGSPLYDGITVRSSGLEFANTNENRGFERLRFRLHSLKPGDTFVRAEIHFHHRSHRPFTQLYRANAFCESCDPQSVQLPSSSSTESASWIIFNASEIVNQAVDGGAEWLEVEFFRRSTRLSAAKIRRINVPFLLVFTKSADYDESTPELQVEVKNRRKRSIDAYYRYVPVDEDARAEQTDPIDEHVENFRRFGPRILQERQTKKPRRPRYDPNDPMLGFGTEVEEKAQTTSSTQSRAAQEDLTVYLLGNQKTKEQQCGKRSFVVRFDEIGWGDIVIAPKKLEVDYCAGSCVFPLSQELNPSNHAQLQSIARQLGLHTDLPLPCCAPQRLDSATLLYYDENGYVVLKNYPRMVVSSCGCV